MKRGIFTAEMIVPKVRSQMIVKAGLRPLAERELRGVDSTPNWRDWQRL